MLVGPEVSGVADDPEGAVVFAECRAQWQTVPESVRGRAVTCLIPMDDVDENAIIVNALQRHATWWSRRAWSKGSG